MLSTIYLFIPVSGPRQMQQSYRNLSFEGKVLNVSKLTEYTWLPRLQL
jgi:hypothetical protein